MKRMIACAMALCLTVPLFPVSSAVAAPAESLWTKLDGGISNETYGRLPFVAEDTADGIRIAGAGNYDPTGHSAGVIWNQPVDVRDFSVELQLEKASFRAYTIRSINGNPVSLGEEEQVDEEYTSGWLRLAGGLLNEVEERAPYEAVNTEDGIQISGQGNYIHEGQAAGLVLKTPLERRNFSVGLQIDEIAGLRDNGVSNWFNVNLLHAPKYFSLGHPEQAKGLNLFIYPKSNTQIQVEVYRISDPRPGDDTYDYRTNIPGWVGIGGATLDVAWNEPMLIEYAVDDNGVGSLTLNDETIAYDVFLAKIEDSWFADGKAYFSTGAASSTDGNFAYTITEVNGKNVALLPQAVMDGIELSQGTLSAEFYPFVTDYTATVANTVEEIAITAEAESNEGLQLAINGEAATVGEPVTASLETGANRIEVEASKAGHESTTYVITVRREAPPSSNPGTGGGSPVLSSNVNLRGLTVQTSSGAAVSLSPAFAADKLSYTASTASAAVQIAAQPEHAGAKVSISGKDGAKSDALKVGSNSFDITVKAENGVTKSYGLLIERTKSKQQEEVKPGNGAPQPGGTSPVSFTDTKGHWAEQAIAEAVKRNIVQGYEDGSFRPDAVITRAQFAVLLARGLGLSGGGAAAASFRDVSASDWFADLLSAVLEAGLIQGLGDGRFAPGGSLTREQLATLLVRAYQYGQGKSGVTIASADIAADEANISQWALADVREALRLGLMVGRGDGRFVPNGTVTRAETVQALLRLFDKLDTGGGNSGEKPKETISDWSQLAGGILSSTNQRGTISMQNSKDGIQVKGTGNYDFAGNAAGAVLHTPVSIDKFETVIRLDKVAGWGKDGVDSWFNFNLLNTPRYFSLGDPSSTKGVTIFVRPQAPDRLGVEVFRLSEPQPGDEGDWVPGWKGIGGGTLDIPWNSELKVEYGVEQGNAYLRINGQLIDSDLSQIKKDWFSDGKAYFSIGAAVSTDAEAAYTIRSVNGVTAALKQEGDEEPAGETNGTTSWLQQALKPIWEGDTAFEETLLLVRDNGRIIDPKLLFKPLKVMTVTNGRGDVRYEEGKDWRLENGRLVVPAGSRMPVSEAADLYPTEYIEGQVFTRVSGGYMLYREGSYFHDRQIKVTYTHKEGEWKGPLPTYADGTLTRTIAKLREGEDLKLLLYGDSISEGQNASGLTGVAPYLPIWGKLVADELDRATDSKITFVNTAVGGKDAAWGQAEAETRAAVHKPDLAIIAFGMNDGTFNVTPQAFKAHIRAIMETIRAANPATEFLLVATTLPNPDTEFYKQQPNYKAVLDQLASEMGGTAVADMTGVHRELLKHKPFADTTGNHINHPNDYLIRLHAQYVLGMLIERS
ncbi:hypothetical protein PAT3040_04901 [Paenibacillus agaridevorans]|uniref:SLH domain-containing protein n=1 Tax=Paenibacillus agaridevorans TaxID=171404 RepID=A0A2R5F1R5_9BACL|nr:S-layer homology domain-containing protein [Paenibacillus agaridevorans]GBG10183.1 hypothetical protein PAT3040_04901 [Paenibacillus agaridevorans]